MPVDLRDIASISGMPGLYRIVSPTRSGVIIETLAENPVRSVAQAKHRISLLHEISIYTNDPDVTVPLTDIFDAARAKYGEEALRIVKLLKFKAPGFSVQSSIPVNFKL